MRVGIDMLNQDIDGSVELELQDGQGSPETARSVTQEMTNSSVPAITGTFSSDVSIALSDLAESEEFPFMTAVSGAPEVTGSEKSYVFRMSANTYQQVKGTLSFFSEVGASNVGLLAADYSYGQSVQRYMEQYSSDYGLSLEYSTLVPPDTSNFVPTLREIPTDSIDALLLVFPGGNGPTLVQQSREQGIFEEVAYPTGFNAYGTTVFKEALGADIEGLYTWSVDLDTDRAQAATEMMLEEYDVRMDALSLPNFDAVNLIGQAIQSADTVSPESIRDQIRDTSYTAASGYEVQFDDIGENTGYQLVVGQWQRRDGDIVNVPQFKSDVLSPAEEPQ
jgi:branched-chain amino acid transport system substrate-binding protein